MIDFAGISEYNEFDTLFCLREYRKAHQMRYFRNAMRNVTDIFSFIYEIDKSIFSILACSVLLTGLAVLPAMYLPKQILDEFADGRDYGKVAGYALIFAALDPLSEYNIYKMIDEFAGNKLMIYISHRLASSRFCDRILLFENRVLAEEGSHESLMAQDTKYKALFRLQAQYYEKQE